MVGPFTHNIDPVLFSVFGVHCWWYGLSFTLGFLNAHIFLRRNRRRLGVSLAAVYDLTLFLAIGVLAGGRALVVVNNEWEFYHDHLLLIPSIWVGGFASHGLIFGGAAGVLLFCYFYKVPFRNVLDVLAISAAIILGFGRFGNFIDGQIYGSLTDLPWGVKFPGVEGFRHPVVLYDGLKNFLLVPFLLWLRRFNLPPGRLAAVFVIAYAGLRIPIDMLREYPTFTLGLPNGQTLNILMVAAGLIFLAINIFTQRSRPAVPVLPDASAPGGLVMRKLALIALLILPLVIPSDATRDVPFTYGSRHPGLTHSWMYPDIQPALDAAQAEREAKRAR